MKNRNVQVFAAGTPAHVIAHATWRHRQHQAGPSSSFNGIQNPRLALQSATREEGRMGCDFGGRLAQYIKSAETAKVPFTTLEMQTLAPGLVAAKDSMGEIDVYFDKCCWKPIDASLWGNSIFPTDLKKMNIGVLPGVGKTPPVKTFAGARSFAKRCLLSQQGTRWYANGPKISLR